jgi:hypothetical protein
MLKLHYIQRSRRLTLAEAAEKHKSRVNKSRHFKSFTLTDTSEEQSGLLYVINEHLGSKSFRNALINIYNGTSCALVGLTSSKKAGLVATVIYPEIEHPLKQGSAVLIHYMMSPSGKLAMADHRLAAELNKEYVIVDNADGSLVGVGDKPVVIDAMHCSYVVNRLADRKVSNNFTIRRLLRPFTPDEALSVIDVTEFFSAAELKGISKDS